MRKPDTNKICPYCLSAIEPTEKMVRCPKCGVMHHAECWTQNGKCSVYGCDGWAIWSEQITNAIAPDSDRYVELSHTDVGRTRETVRCIKCGAEIKPGKLICRKCKKGQPRKYKENCAGPSIIMLSIFIGIITIIVKTIV